METEAGMTMANLMLIGAAGWKMLTFWWPVIVVTGLMIALAPHIETKGNE